MSEGLPMSLSLSAADSTYGLAIQAGYAPADPHAVSYALDPSLTLRPLASTLPAPAYASYGTTTGSLNAARTAAAEGTQIRFLPDGTIDESSPGRIVLQHRNGSGLQLSLNDTRLAYEILPWTSDANPR